MCTGENTNKSAASSLRERLAAKKAEAQQAADAGVKKEEDTKTNEACMKAEDADAKPEVKPENHTDEKTGQAVQLGKRSLGEGDICAADKATNVGNGEEKPAVQDLEPPAKRISQKDEPDSVMDLWSELTDAPNEGAEGDAADEEPAEVCPCYLIGSKHCIQCCRKYLDTNCTHGQASCPLLEA